MPREGDSSQVVVEVTHDAVGLAATSLAPAAAEIAAALAALGGTLASAADESGIWTLTLSLPLPGGA